MSIPLPHIPVGGRLTYFHRQWEQMTSDPEILKMVSGFSLPMVDFEPQKSVPYPLRFSPHEHRAADEEIQKLLAKDAIMKCDGIYPGDFVSTVFIRPKKNGGPVNPGSLPVQ